MADDWISGLVGAGQSILNLINSERDRNYQQNLQQKIFEREDNAVQRRMEDLKAAGINPNLAAGSAASAGSVVGRSETPRQDLGSAMDAISAMNQIKQQRQATQNLKTEGDILTLQRNKQQQDWTYQRAQDLATLGFNPIISYGPDGKIHVKSNVTSHDFNSTPLGKMFNNQVNISNLQTDLLNKDAQWYTADKISGMAFNLLGMGNSLFNWKKIIGGK